MLIVDDDELKLDIAEEAAVMAELSLSKLSLLTTDFKIDVTFFLVFSIEFFPVKAGKSSLETDLLTL